MFYFIMLIILIIFFFLAPYLIRAVIELLDPEV